MLKKEESKKEKRVQEQSKVRLLYKYLAKLYLFKYNFK